MKRGRGRESGDREREREREIKLTAGRRWRNESQKSPAVPIAIRKVKTYS